jgi:hypothetical protein
MACGDFIVPRTPCSCACCGDTILAPTETSQYRRVHFVIRKGQAHVPLQSTFASFCPSCAGHDWTHGDWLISLERQSHAMWALDTVSIRPGWDHTQIQFVGPEPRPIQTYQDLI